MPVAIRDELREQLQPDHAGHLQDGSDCLPPHAGIVGRSRVEIARRRIGVARVKSFELRTSCSALGRAGPGSFSPSCRTSAIYWSKVQRRSGVLRWPGGTDEAGNVGVQDMRE